MRYVIAVLAIIGLIILGVIVFGGHSSKKATGPAVTAKTLSDYANTTAQVRLTTDGVINGDDAHRQIQITIGRDQRTVNVIQGYQGNVISSESLANNESAYDVFLRAISGAGFTNIRKTNLTDDRGVCPLGFRYIFELIGSDGNDFRRWASSCGGFGTFGGQLSLERSLFHSQITNYDQFTNQVSLQ